MKDSKPIKKFRGVSRYSGKTIFGGIAFDEAIQKYFIDDEAVDTETVAQLVGFDANGGEVYEGDTLRDKTGHEYIATLDPMLIWNKDPNFKYWHLPFNQNSEVQELFDNLTYIIKTEFDDNKEAVEYIDKLQKLLYAAPHKTLYHFAEHYTELVARR